MSRIVLVTGGARSGKSTYAEKICLDLAKDRLPVYIATAVAFDDEMKERILKHRQRREGKFTTVEACLELPKAIEDNPNSVVLVDCLTVWANNLLYYGKEDLSFAYSYVDSLIQVLKNREKDIILVTNETGSGIVPDNKLAREFRDLSGIINQKVASVSSDVIMTVCSIPMAVKGSVL